MARKKKAQSGHFAILQETAENRYSALGPSFQGFDNFAEADAAAKARRDQFPHQSFVVVQCIARYSHVTRPIVTRLVESPPQPSVDVVEFPRIAVSN